MRCFRLRLKRRAIGDAVARGGNERIGKLIRGRSRRSSLRQVRNVRKVRRYTNPPFIRPTRSEVVQEPLVGEALWRLTGIGQFQGERTGMNIPIELSSVSATTEL